MDASSVDLSVVVVSDYWSGNKESWEDLRQCISALTSQVGSERVELLFCEDRKFQAAIPEELLAIAPDMKVCLVDSSESVVLKNEGVRQARAPLVAIIDGDCTPAPDWIRNILYTFGKHKEIAVLSGRTKYRDRTAYERILGLLSRAYLDPGRSAKTRFIANNNMAFRREAYLEHPLPSGYGPFVAEIQAEALRRAGYILWYEPEMLVIHEFDGWAMERDLRRNSGFGLIASRLSDGRLPFAALIRQGVIAIPAIVAGRTMRGWNDTLRCWRSFGLRAWEVPFSFVLSAVVHLLEIPGMFAAYRGSTTGKSAYR